MSAIAEPLPASAGLPQQHNVGRQIGEKCIRSGIAIGGLLIIRAVASVLPMLKYADPIWYRSPADLSGVSNVPQSMESFQSAVQKIMQAVSGTQLQKGWLAAIYSRSGAEAADSALKGLIAMHLAIFPVTVVRVAIDTVVLALVLRLGYELGAIIREKFTRVPSLGQLLTLFTAIFVVTLAYGVYQGIFYPLLGPENVNYYGWFFLALGIVPLIGIIVSASKNMDAITGVIFRSAQAMAGALKCSGCGRPLAVGAKFCPYCGAVAESAIAASEGSKRYCASCGVENPSGARFCKGCGQTISA